MRIKRFIAENVKRLKVVDITPDGSVVQITGANGSGKSSVLDAIWYAVAGTKSIPSQPIRKGQESAKVQLDLGDIIITRKFTQSGSTLSVEAADGATYKSPQTMLDEMMNSLTFDPLAFLRMEPKKQLEQLRRVVKLDVDVDLIASRIAAIFNERTEINRLVKSLRVQAEAIKVPADLPDDLIDVSALLQEMDDAGDHNVEIEKARNTRQRASEKLQGEIRKVQNYRDQAEELRGRAHDLEAEAERVEKWIETTQAAHEELEPLPDPIDVSELRYKVEQSQTINESIRIRQNRTTLLLGADDAQKKADNCSKDIDALTKERADAIANAEMPVPGLSFGEGEVMLDGLPLEQASGAQQLRLSVAIAMAGNPKLRVLRIKEGSLLDENGLALIGEMAEERDYQIWIERVDTSGKVGVVMEDGSVRGETNLPDEFEEQEQRLNHPIADVENEQ